VVRADALRSPLRANAVWSLLAAHDRQR